MESTQLEPKNSGQPAYVKQFPDIANLSEIDVLMLIDICEGLLQLGIGKIDSLEWSYKSKTFHEIKRKLDGTSNRA